MMTSHSNHCYRTIHTASILLALVGLAGCSGSRSAPAAPREEAARVEVDHPRQRDVIRQIIQPGEIKALEETPIHARISGYVSRIHKDIGDRVGDGTVLAELAVPEMDEELVQKAALVEQAEDEIKQAQALLTVAEKDLSSATARVKEAEAGQLRASAELKRAETQLERLKKSTSVVAQGVLDETELTVDSAKATLTEVMAKVVSARAAEAAATARRDKANADIKVAQATSHKPGANLA
jgi:multidrug efflux pump subunit AcrA (membrane-fusion protein)